MFWKKLFSTQSLIVSVYKLATAKSATIHYRKVHNSEPETEEVILGETVVAWSKQHRAAAGVFPAPGKENLQHILPYNGFPGAFYKYLDC